VDLYIDEEGRVEIIEIERFDRNDPFFADYCSLPDYYGIAKRAALFAKLQGAIQLLQQRSVAACNATYLFCQKEVQAESDRYRRSAGFMKTSHVSKSSQSRFKDLRHNQRHLTQSSRAISCC
jgi:hypothetical protein